IIFLTFVFGIIFLLLGGLILFYEPYQKFIPNYVEGAGAFIGTFFGILIGIFITFATQRINENILHTQRIKNFLLELDINEEKLSEWINEISNLRNSVNGDSLHTYFYYYKLSSFLGVAAQQLHLTGEVYHLLTKEQFRQIQQAYEELSAGWETAMNDRITQ